MLIAEAWYYFFSKSQAFFQKGENVKFGGHIYTKVYVSTENLCHCKNKYY